MQVPTIHTYTVHVLKYLLVIITNCVLGTEMSFVSDASLCKLEQFGIIHKLRNAIGVGGAKPSVTYTSVWIHRNQLKFQTRNRNENALQTIKLCKCNH